MIRQIEVTENILFYCSRITWWSSRTHTHPAHFLDTSEEVAKLRFSFLSLITRFQNSKSGQYRLTAGSKLVGWNAPRHKRQLLCSPADIHSVIRFPHTCNNGCSADIARQDFAEWAERTLTCRCKLSF